MLEQFLVNLYPLTHLILEKTKNEIFFFFFFFSNITSIRRPEMIFFWLFTCIRQKEKVEFDF